MSILQEYDEIRDALGSSKYDSIDEYLEEICPDEKINIYNNKVIKLIQDKPNNWFDEIDNLKKDMNITMFVDVLYKEKEWCKYNIWYNNHKLHRNIKILNSWNTDYRDTKYNVLLTEGNKEIGNIICSYESDDIDLVKSDIYDSWNSYRSLPKISKCGKLTQKVYDEVCESDYSMCYITDKDWNEYYKDRFNDKDLIRLKEDIKNYNLDKVIEIDYGEYKILGYSDLETRFNDDRCLNREKDRDER